MYKYGLLLMLCILGSCGLNSKDHTLPANYKDVIPYLGNEIFIFESNTQQRDTIFINGITKAMLKGGDGLSIHPDRYENLRINYTNTTKNKEGGLLYLSWFDHSYTMRFEFDMGHSRLFHNTTYSKNEYDLLPSTQLQIMGRTITDIKIFNTDPYYEDRPERILNFYWSTASGLMGWDTPSTSWRLIQVN